MQALLRDRGMRLLVSCSVCRLEDRSTEHAILYYPRIRLIWRMARSQPWEEDDGSWLSPFLDMIR